MASRMEKYHLSDTKANHSRSEKNSHLYEELYTNKVYTEFTDVQNNIVDLNRVSTAKSSSKREDYKKSRLLNEETDIANRNSFLYSDVVKKDSLEEKNYNINDVLENARKNRKELDEEEKKRHLKTVEYSILSDLSQEKEKQEQNKKLSKAEEENLQELIHTITSNSLRKKIDDQLLNELLPSDDSESIVSEQLLKDIEAADNGIKESMEEEKNIEETMDQSFYTRSMDLSEEDFEFEDEDEEDKSFLEENKMKKSSKIIIALIVILIVSIVGFIIFSVI